MMEEPMNTPHRQLVLLFSIAILCAPLRSFGQTTATITGIVTDASGAVIPGVGITITNIETDQTRSATTNETGRYYAPALNPGNYKVSASLPGFEVVVRSGITLTVGNESVINFTLKPGQVSETVDVTGEAPLVQTTNSTVSELVSDLKIRALPLNGRSYDQLIYMQPGINVAPAAGNSPNQGRGTKFSANGARLTSNYFMLDGTDINDSQNFTPGSASGQLFGVESILEFQVLTHNQSAQYGRSMGAVINAVTRSGNNTLHGSAYEFLRNSALDAKNYFDDPRAPIPPFKWNQFGATAGGPIEKDHVFFFTNYEGFRERRGLSKNALVPDQAARNGDLPGQAHINVNQAIVPYLNLYPMPNFGQSVNGIGQYRYTQVQPTRADYGTAKIDWNATAKDSFFTRYTIDDSDKLRMDADDHIIGLFAEAEKHRNQYVTMQWTRTFSPSVVNIGRFGFNRSVTLVDLSDIGNVPASLNFISGQPFGRMSISGMSPCCATINDPRYFRMNSFQPSDDVSMIRGKHTVKAGAVLERFQWNTANFNRIGGDYVFSSLANFLRGSVQTVDVPFPGSDPIRGIRAALFGTYVQDDYRVSQRLTLNLGLRYELTTVPTEVNGKLSFLETPYSTELKKELPYPGNHLNFAPRFGFAWDAEGNGKTAVRGGFGMFYDQILMNQFLNLYDRNPPYWLTARLAGAAAPFPHPLDAAQISAQYSPQIIWRDDFNTPYAYQYNLSIQREIMTNLSATIGYVGSIGKHLVQRFDGNTPLPQRLADGTLFTPAGAPRRNPVWGNIPTRRLAGFSDYNALQISVNRRFAQGLQVQGSYTFAKSIDTSSGLFSEEAGNAPVGAVNPDNFLAEKGLSNFDIRHNAVINFNYELPFGKKLSGIARQIGGGWELGSITTLSSGIPFTVENSANRSQNQTSGADRADRPNLRPGFSSNPTRGLSAGCTYGATIAAGTPVGTPSLWFDPCAFQPQPLGTFGNLGRNTLIGPDLKTVDFVLNKHFRIREGRELQFRSEFFNSLNRVNLSPPLAATRQIFDNNGFLAGSYGQITKTTTPSRQIQFGLKYIF
jgi:hypothetical protein